MNVNRKPRKKVYVIVKYTFTGQCVVDKIFSDPVDARAYADGRTNKLDSYHVLQKSVLGKI